MRTCLSCVRSHVGFVVSMILLWIYDMIKILFFEYIYNCLLVKWWTCYFLNSRPRSLWRDPETDLLPGKEPEVWHESPSKIGLRKWQKMCWGGWRPQTTESKQEVSLWQLHTDWKRMDDLRVSSFHKGNRWYFVIQETR